VTDDLVTSQLLLTSAADSFTISTMPAAPGTLM
jgi:hypothetical protein